MFLPHLQVVHATMDRRCQNIAVLRLVLLGPLFSGRLGMESIHQT